MSAKDALMNFAKFLGMDYIIHQKDASKFISDYTADALYSVSTNTFGLWLLGDSNSKFLTRQIIASSYHFSRIATTCGMVAADFTFSSIFRAINPKSQNFSSLAVSQRAYKRLMLSLRLNGGVYSELSSIIRNSVDALSIVPAVKPFAQINHEYPVAKKQISPSSQTTSETLSNYSLDEIKTLFYKQTGKQFDSVFSDVHATPREIGMAIVHDAVLRTGEKVSITIIPPHVQRMRSLDLLPFYVIRGALTFVPFIGLEKSAFDALLGRLSYSLTKEVKVRQDILTKIGIDVKQAPKLLFNQSRKSNFPGYIAAPISELCTRNIMVSDVAPYTLNTVPNVSIARKTVDTFSSLLFQYGTIIPDLSFDNLRKTKGRVTFARFGTAVPVKNETLHALLRIPTAIKKGDIEQAQNYGRILGASRGSVSKSIHLGSIDKSLAKDIARSNMKAGFATAEAAVGLLTLRKQARNNAFLAPAAIGALAKRYRPDYDHTKFPFSLGLWTKYIPF